MHYKSLGDDVGVDLVRFLFCKGKSRKRIIDIMGRWLKVDDDFFVVERFEDENEIMEAITVI